MVDDRTSLKSFESLLDAPGRTTKTGFASARRFFAPPCSAPSVTPRFDCWSILSAVGVRVSDGEKRAGGRGANGSEGGVPLRLGGEVTPSHRRRGGVARELRGTPRRHPAARPTVRVKAELHVSSLAPAQAGKLRGHAVGDHVVAESSNNLHRAAVCGVAVPWCGESAV